MASTQPFADKVIAITGGASGIGLATARYLSARGATVSICDIQAGALKSAQDSIHAINPTARVLTAVVDVRRSNEVEAWIALTVDKFGSLSGAANLAGTIGSKSGTMTVKTYLDSKWELILGVNLTGMFNCLRAELKVIEDGGSIVNAASAAGLMGFVHSAAYSSSKHGVVGLTRTAAKECRESKVRVNAICPGLIATPMVKAADTSRGALVDTGAVFQRRGEPEEVSALIAYLLGDESRFTTGAAYTIDGGLMC